MLVRLYACLPRILFERCLRSIRMKQDGLLYFCKDMKDFPVYGKLGSVLLTLAKEISIKINKF